MTGWWALGGTTVSENAGLANHADPTVRLHAFPSGQASMCFRGACRKIRSYDNMPDHVFSTPKHDQTGSEETETVCLARTVWPD